MMSGSKAIASYHNSEALKFSQSGHFKEAMEHVNLAAKHSHSLSTIHSKALVLFQMNDIDASLEEFKLALSIGKVNEASPEELAKVELDYANALLKTGDFKEAIQHFKEHLMKIPRRDSEIGSRSDDVKTKFELAEAHFQHETGKWLESEGIHQEAISCYKKSLAHFRSSANEYKRADVLGEIEEAIGCNYLAGGNLEAARLHFKAAIDERGTRVYQLAEYVDKPIRDSMIEAEIEKLIGDWYGRLNYHEEAIKYYEQSIALYKRWVTPAYSIAKQYLVMGKYKEFKRAFNKGVRILNKHGGTKEEIVFGRCLWAEFSVAMNVLKEAIRMYKLAVEESDDEILRINLEFLEEKKRGLDCHKRGRFSQAIEHYSKALELKSEDVEVNFNIGRCYFKLSNLVAAQKHYERCMSRDPFLVLKLHKNLYKFKLSKKLGMNRL